VVAAAVAVVQPQATTKGVRLMDLGSGEPGVPYLGDEHRVRQVLVNLLANAVKFTPPTGEVTVTCGAAPDPDPGVWTASGTPPRGADRERPRGWAFVRVADTGPGIAPELLGRLFEPFVQGDGALTREHGGTGLGLAISRRLARLMDGDLVVRSQPGAGATFTLWLPSTTDVGTGIETSTMLRPESSERAISQQMSGGPSRPTPPRGAVVIAPEAEALDATAYAVLHALAVRLAAEAETVAERYVDALRADGRFPGVRALPSVQLRDHASPFVGLIASQLMVIGETRGEAPQLLGDGAQLQRVMSELHGAQRHRLGWSENDIERETRLLLAEIERALRAALDTKLPDATGTEEAAGAAARYAAVLSRHMLEQATGTAVRAYRFAKATATL
jgi:hypothetical protein